MKIKRRSFEVNIKNNNFTLTYLQRILEFYQTWTSAFYYLQVEQNKIQDFFRIYNILMYTRSIKSILHVDFIK